ncbi:MAG: chaperonin GroEL [Methylococcaceae bacterium]
MTKQVIYNPQARLQLMNGINRVANATITTLGSSGSAVMIQHRTAGIAPVFTRDGVTVARSIILNDRIEDLGGRMLRDVAGAVSRQAGDGTTTSIVLAQKLAQESLKSIAAGFHPVQLKKGLDLALDLIEQQLHAKAITTINDDIIEKIVAVATKNEPHVGQLLAEALNQLGIHGSLSFQLGNGREDELAIVDGIHYEQGYLSPYFMTDKTREEAVLDNPYILLYDREIDDLMDLIPILEQVNEQHRSLLIIADDVIDKALTGLLLNHIRGIFKVVAVKPPSFGDKRQNRLKDLALLTGGTAILDDYNSPRLEQLTLAHLGQAEKVIISANSTTIIGAKGDSIAIESLANYLRLQAQLLLDKKPGQGSATGNKHDFEELQDRLASLYAKTGVFSVGGITDFEIKERLVRIENAYMSAKAALEEGVVAGGGVALFNCITSLNNVIAENAHVQQGITIMQQVLAQPLKMISANAGFNSEAVIAKLESYNDVTIAFNTQSQQYGHFLEIGVIDAVKVMRLALRTAVSIVSTLMTTETIIMDVPDTSIMDGYSPEWAAATREDPRA